MKEIIKKFKRLQGKHDLWLIYSDFLEMMAISVANSTERIFNKKRFEERESEYFRIIKKYDLPTFPSISRARRKVQEIERNTKEDKDWILQSTKTVEKRRRKLEDEYREYYKNKVGTNG